MSGVFCNLCVSVFVVFVYFPVSLCVCEPWKEQMHMQSPQGYGEDNMFFLLLQAEPLMPLLFQVSGDPRDSSQAPGMDEVKSQFIESQAVERWRILEDFDDRQEVIECGGGCLWRTLCLCGKTEGSWIPGKEGMNVCIW